MVVADPALKVSVPFTNSAPWFTSVSSLVYGLMVPPVLTVSLIVQVVVPVPVACCSVGGMWMSSELASLLKNP